MLKINLTKHECIIVLPEKNAENIVNEDMTKENELMSQIPHIIREKPQQKQWTNTYSF